MLMHFRNIRKTSQDLYMSDPIDMDKDGNPLTLIDIVSDGTDMAEDLELKLKSETLFSLIQSLNDPREKEIIILRYGLNNKKPLTQREVAEHLHISRSYVSRIEKKVLQKLRKQFH